MRLSQLITNVKDGKVIYEVKAGTGGAPPVLFDVAPPEGRISATIGCNGCCSPGLRKPLDFFAEKEYNKIAYRRSCSGDETDDRKKAYVRGRTHSFSKAEYDRGTHTG